MTVASPAPPVVAPPGTNPAERALRRIDAFQQRHTVTAFVFAVIKKFADDRGGLLAALFAYFACLAIFPLLLLLVTFLGLVLNRYPSLQEHILNSAWREFPIIGNQLRDNIHSLKARGAGFVFGTIGLLWGSLGLAQVGQFAMAEVWNEPGVSRPNFLHRLRRSVIMLGVLGLGVVVSSAASLLATVSSRQAVVSIIALLSSLLSNVFLFVLAFRVLSPRSVPTRQLLPGGIGAGAGWTALQAAAGVLVGHWLRHANQLYGFFGIVLGFLSFLSLGGAITLYAAESNVVLARHLWPRSLLQPPLTHSDRDVLAAIAEQEERRPEQDVIVTFKDKP
jgi:YihY family inner membrane protein